MPLSQTDLADLVSALQTIKISTGKLKKSIEVQKLLLSVQSGFNKFAKRSVAKKVTRDVLADDWELLRETGFSEVNNLVYLSENLGGSDNDLVAIAELKRIMECATNPGVNLQKSNMGVVKNACDSLVNEVAQQHCSCAETSTLLDK